MVSERPDQDAAGVVAVGFGPLPEQGREVSSVPSDEDALLIRRQVEDTCIVQRPERGIREELGCEAGTMVTISELTCTEPGCPPLETVISVFPDGQDSFLVKVAKPVAEVELLDLWRPWRRSTTNTDRRRPRRPSRRVCS